MNVSRLACVSTVFLTFLPLALSARAASSVALVLDASGSMNAKLPEGKTRIEAAKLAVTDLVGKLPTDVRLSLWAYGHQSPTSKHDCRDAQRVVEFAAISANKADVLTKTSRHQSAGLHTDYLCHQARRRRSRQGRCKAAHHYFGQ